MKNEQSLHTALQPQPTSIFWLRLREIASNVFQRMRSYLKAATVWGLMLGLGSSCFVYRIHQQLH
jgi:hypothetical protein